MATYTIRQAWQDPEGNIYVKYLNGDVDKFVGMQIIDVEFNVRPKEEIEETKETEVVETK